MIGLRRVTKSYKADGRRKYIMRDVTMDFPRRRSVGLLGRNGSGKSTLLRMIGGAIEPDAGEIVSDVKISWPLGFAGGLHGALTGAQNARFIARIYGVDTDAMREKVEEFAEIGPFINMPVQSYSSGMRARLAFAVSMAVDFEVYLVDEITAVGDIAFRQKAAAAFKSKAVNSDIIIVSHSTSTIREYCQSGAVLEGGELVWFDDVEDAIKAHNENMKKPAPMF